MNLSSLFFSFEGRISRQPFWLCTLIIVAIIFLPALALYDDIGSKEAGTFISIMCLVLLWPFLAIQAKRWHDRDKSGWWLLIIFVPLGLFWVLIDTGLLPGTEGTNRFGDDPYAAKVMNKFDEVLRAIFILIGCIVGIVFIFTLIVGLMDEYFHWFPRAPLASDAGALIWIITLFYGMGGWLLNLLALNLFKHWHPKRWVKRTAIILNIMPMILMVLSFLGGSSFLFVTVFIHNFTDFDFDVDFPFTTITEITFILIYSIGITIFCIWAVKKLIKKLINLYPS